MNPDERNLGPELSAGEREVYSSDLLTCCIYESFEISSLALGEVEFPRVPSDLRVARWSTSDWEARCGECFVREEFLSVRVRRVWSEKV